MLIRTGTILLAALLALLSCTCLGNKDAANKTLPQTGQILQENGKAEEEKLKQKEIEERE